MWQGQGKQPKGDEGKKMLKGDEGKTAKGNEGKKPAAKVDGSNVSVLYCTDVCCVL